MIAISETPDVANDLSASTEASEIAYQWARFRGEHHRNSDITEIARLRRYIQSRAREIAQNQRECEDQLENREEQAAPIPTSSREDASTGRDRLTELEASRTHFLRRSVVMYARALGSSDAHERRRGRLISLWFETQTMWKSTVIDELSLLKSHLASLFLSCISFRLA